MYYCLKCKTSLGDDDIEERKCPFCKTPCLDEYDFKSAQRGKEIIKELTELVNSISSSPAVPKAMALSLAQSHRTLQQSAMKLLYEIIVEYSKHLKEWGTDLRNEEAKKFADRVASLEEVYFPLT